MHCKVTSSVKLLGNDKSLGQGGWGHIIYTAYDTPAGITAYSDGQTITRNHSKIDIYSLTANAQDA